MLYSFKYKLFKGIYLKKIKSLINFVSIAQEQTHSTDFSVISHDVTENIKKSNCQASKRICVWKFLSCWMCVFAPYNSLQIHKFNNKQVSTIGIRSFKVQPGGFAIY